MQPICPTIGFYQNCPLNPYVHADVKKPAAGGSTIIMFVVSGTSFSIPVDWSDVNTIEGLGGPGTAGSGASGSTSQHGGGGGGPGGGAYNKITNLAGLTPGGSVPIQIGVAGTSDTIFRDSSTLLIK